MIPFSAHMIVSVNRQMNNHVRLIMACTFFIESMARGYHKYVWKNPVSGVSIKYGPLSLLHFFSITELTVTSLALPNLLSAP